MKLTTPLKIFLSAALLAGGAQAASLSLGAGGLGQSHSTADPAGTLVYTDPSGIKISYFGQPQAQFGNGAGTRGWSNDPNTGIKGFGEITSAAGDHLAIAHFGNSTSGTTESINIDFSSASNVNLATVRLQAFDLDTLDGSLFVEEWAISGNPTLVGIGVDGVGAMTHDVPLAVGGSGLVTLTPNQNPSGTSGLSGFTVTWDAVPEPSTGLLALLGSSVLFFRRRR